MPYVPSEKTDGKSQDRNLIDAKVEALANAMSETIVSNMDVYQMYMYVFRCMKNMNYDTIMVKANTVCDYAIALMDTVKTVGAGYGYAGAYLGELNYAITRLIQRVPALLAKNNKCGLVVGKELRYWLYAITVDALISAAQGEGEPGVNGVFEDIKDEYKVRVNKSYEIAQILKSGDCYDTPYFNKVVEVVDENGKVLGHTYIELTNDGKNVLLDKMPYKLLAITTL